MICLNKLNYDDNDNNILFVAVFSFHQRLNQMHVTILKIISILPLQCMI